MSQFNYVSYNHGWFKDLLLSFLEATYLDYDKPENISDNEFAIQRDLATIKKYVEELDAQYITKTIKQGREILALEEFPWEWVGDTANRMPISKNFPFKRWDDVKSEDYYEWVTWIIDELEKYAKLAGKYN